MINFDNNKIRKVVLEGSDGIGKTTLAEYLLKDYGFDTIHSSSETENTLEYHRNILNYDFPAVYDRFNLGEIVYPIIYNRRAKMNFREHEELMQECKDRNDTIYIIMYASNFNDLKQRLFSRGDVPAVLDNAKSINYMYIMLYKQLVVKYDNIYGIDISTDGNQILRFNEILSMAEARFSPEEQ